MRWVVTVLVLVGCGENENNRRLPDAPVVADAVIADAEVIDTPPAVACTFVAANTAAPTGMTFTLTGGAFQSYGCAPVDPTYWMYDAGMSFEVTFATPQVRPSIRVWGMNTDDTATATVNGTAYALTTASASLSTKVVCGLSPGPDGMAFVNGSLTGANTPGQGNYSYQDVTIEQSAVTSIRLAGTAGAGWGVAGASIGDCGPGPVVK